MKTFLDHGFVELIDMMGDDYRILQSARVSTGGNAKKGDKADRGLIRYLYKNKHMTPFEQVVFTFHAKVPNFVMKQYLRHRTFSTNEYSQRYSPIINEYYTPEDWRIQGKTNHQGSGDTFEPFENFNIALEYEEAMDLALYNYEVMIKRGVAKEMARMVIPSSIYTEFYFTADLRNLLHFLELRCHKHAQLEIRVFAEAILEILKEKDELKWTMEIYEEMTALDWKLQELLTNKIEPRSIINSLDNLC
ncbi:MAG: FAD-dependent thymidylate synthase [Bacteroidetes bacterium]|nr:MAG: FAD-dependent thymidylate synthase [Bacteroidota bacterium]